MTHPTALRLLPLVAWVALSACRTPDPVAHATLGIGGDGQYTFKHQAVERHQLASALQKAKQENDSLLVDVEVTPKTDMAAIQFALDAIRSAHARVAFAHPHDSATVAQSTTAKGDAAE
jgi:biopolymer transport protein ExbD